RPVRRGCSAESCLPRRICQGRTGATDVVAHGRRFRHRYVAADSLEQLRRLHERGARRPDHSVLAIRHLQHRQPTDRPALWLHGYRCRAAVRVGRQELTRDERSAGSLTDSPPKSLAGRTVLGTSHAEYPTSILEIQFFRHFLSGPDGAIVTVVNAVFHFCSAGSFPPGRALISEP